MKSTDSDVKKILDLALMDLSEEERSELLTHIDKMFLHLKDIDDVDTDSLKPYFMESIRTLELDEDEPREDRDVEDLIKDFPKSQERYLEVDKFVKKGN